VRRTLAHRALVLCVVLAACAAPPAEPIEHVVVFGVDGMSPAGLASASTPNIDALVASGASSFTAEAVLPTTSAPNWASMIMGIEPEAHGIVAKKWDAAAARGRSFCGEPPGRVPTNVFRVLRAHEPGADVVAVYEWLAFGDLLEPEDATRVRAAVPRQTAAAAIERIASGPPRLLFVQFVHVDNLGHRFGHGSPEYVAGVEEVDAKIGEVLAALDAAGVRARTAVVVTSDHGGVGREHGGDSPEEVQIPWILAGPGVRRGYAIEDPIRTPDTAATIVTLLGAPVPDCWTGRPVTAALER